MFLILADPSLKLVSYENKLSVASFKKGVTMKNIYTDSYMIIRKPICGIFIMRLFPIVI